jgi:DNA-3-methyladenine glycosylase I
MNNGIIKGADGKHRCWWCGDDQLYMAYHDNEWGKHVTSDVRLFEKICLEGFQAGLSWITILRKRENFRVAFQGFDFHKVSKFTEQDVERLLQDAGIIRHRGKIEATINNAQRIIELIAEEGTFYNYLQRFQSERDTGVVSRNDIPSFTDKSKEMSKDLKKRGFKFVGPTTCYAFMQAMGMVNDHIDGCKFTPNQ